MKVVYLLIGHLGFSKKTKNKKQKIKKKNNKFWLENQKIEYTWPFDTTMIFINRTLWKTNSCKKAIVVNDNTRGETVCRAHFYRYHCTDSSDAPSCCRTHTRCPLYRVHVSLPQAPLVLSVGRAALTIHNVPITRHATAYGVVVSRSSEGSRRITL